MIKVKATKKEIDISGSSKDLLSLKDDITQFIISKDNETIIKAESGFNPSPYPFALEQIILRKGNGKNRFEIDGCALYITGSPLCLQNIVDNLPLEGDKGTHVHYDHLILEDYVDDISPDVIITLRI
ncbi:MAG TPA: hypothetical protein DCZ94_14380 [Lentisphaeria bacterium]|nr:MAG: hypothetical protein A2X48_01655 [Lentisphaerae bacterium GWF2_49_21]HBC88134.1 hypothetical protein [Lentisphaeria bacterium]